MQDQRTLQLLLLSSCKQEGSMGSDRERWSGMSGPGTWKSERNVESEIGHARTHHERLHLRLLRLRTQHVVELCVCVQGRAFTAHITNTVTRTLRPCWCWDANEARFLREADCL